MLLASLVLATCSSGPDPEWRHSGGGLTSVVMATIVDKLPPVSPPASGVRDGNRLMRTIRLSGNYRGDVPLVLPSYTRLVLEGSISALPYRLRWTAASAGAPQQTAALVSAKGAVMVSVEGGSWTCAGWNSSAADGNTTTVGHSVSRFVATP